MHDNPCALAADTLVETPEGPAAIRTLAGKPVSVFTREPSGRIRFRRLLDVRRIAEQQPVLRITLETGASFRVAPWQVLFRTGLEECRADALRPGDGLEPAFHYPEGYAYRDDRDGETRVSLRALRVTAVAADGVADLYSFGVNRTGCFFVTAGVLCKAAADR